MYYSPRAYSTRLHFTEQQIVIPTLDGQIRHTHEEQIPAVRIGETAQKEEILQCLRRIGYLEFAHIEHYESGHIQSAQRTRIARVIRNLKNKTRETSGKMK